MTFDADTCCCDLPLDATGIFAVEEEGVTVHVKDDHFFYIFCDLTFRYHSVVVCSTVYLQALLQMGVRERGGGLMDYLEESCEGTVGVLQDDGRVDVDVSKFSHVTSERVLLVEHLRHRDCFSWDSYVERQVAGV